MSARKPTIGTPSGESGSRNSSDDGAAVCEIGPTFSSAAEQPCEEPWLNRDVPARCELEDDLRQTRLELEDANREVEVLRRQLATEISEREQLLSVVGHELRTPVTVIRGYRLWFNSQETCNRFAGFRKSLSGAKS